MRMSSLAQRFFKIRIVNKTNEGIKGLISLLPSSDYITYLFSKKSRSKVRCLKQEKIYVGKESYNDIDQTKEATMSGFRNAIQYQTTPKLS